MLIEEGLQIDARALSEPASLDRAAGKPVIMASAAGGMDIEEVAENTPEKIVRVYIDPASASSRSRRASWLCDRSRCAAGDKFVKLTARCTTRSSKATRR